MNLFNSDLPDSEMEETHKFQTHSSDIEPDLSEWLENVPFDANKELSSLGSQIDAQSMQLAVALAPLPPSHDGVICSWVIGDLFHLIDQVKIPQRHGLH